ISGAAYAGVQPTVPASVTFMASPLGRSRVRRTRPKSRTFTKSSSVPAPLTKLLAGLMSRWVRPVRCAWARESHTCLRMWMARPPDLAHAAGTEPLLESVGAELVGLADFAAEVVNDARGDGRDGDGGDGPEDLADGGERVDGAEAQPDRQRQRHVREDRQAQ